MQTDQTAWFVLQDIKGQINFKGIQFMYPSRPGALVLNGFNLLIGAGQTVALVGISGCGKSTCIHLLERFYNSFSGAVVCEINSVC